MIIGKIETFPLRIPFKRGGTSAAAAWGDKDLPAADSLLVEVTTDQGLEGWGVAFGFRAVTSAKLAIDELIAPLCIGQDASRIAPQAAFVGIIDQFEVMMIAMLIVSPLVLFLRKPRLAN